MIWKDLNLNNKPCLPISLFYFGFFLANFLIYGAIRAAMIHSDFKDKIITIFGVLFFIYFAIYNLFLILKGHHYIKSVQKADDFFILKNFFNKEIRFNNSEIHSIALSKVSFFEKYLTNFADKEPTYNLILKNQRLYRITSHIENIETLLGELSMHTTLSLR